MLETRKFCGVKFLKMEVELIFLHPPLDYLYHVGMYVNRAWELRCHFFITEVVFRLREVGWYVWKSTWIFGHVDVRL